MQPAHLSEVAESVKQAVDAWRALTSTIDGVDQRDDDGLAFAYSDVPLPFMNMIVLRDIVEEASALERLSERASAYMGSREFPGLFMVCEDLLSPDLRAHAPEIIGRYDLQAAMPLTGMVANSLIPAVRPAAGLTFRRVETDETATVISDLNCFAYGIPIELGRASLPASMWRAEGWGYIAYSGDKPVSCAATFPVDGRLYVGLVATLPETQRRGYAEAAMRHALEQASKATGLTRTVLHATDAGRPVYTRMGYHDTSKFVMYAAPMAH